MPLDKKTLIKDIIEALYFDTESEEGPFPELKDVAEALADAIEKYVKSGDVVGVDVSVTTDDGVAGTGTQNNKGKIE